MADETVLAKIALDMAIDSMAATEVLRQRLEREKIALDKNTFASLAATEASNIRQRLRLQHPELTSLLGDS